MIPEIASAITSTKAALDIVKFVVDTAKETAVREKVFELHGVILDLRGLILDLQERVLALQDDSAALKEKIREQKAEIEKHHQWDEAARRYKLTELSPRSFAYEYQKAGQGDPTPAHYACVCCFDQKKKSVLQWSGDQALRCPGCGSMVFTGR